jgi:hypothetical protein
LRSFLPAAKNRSMETPKFQVRANGPNRVDVEFSGKLDSDEMREAIDELVTKAEGVEHGRMLFRVGDYQLPTLGAIALEFSRFFELYGMIRKFDRAALIADQAWIRTVGEIEGALFPGLEIKAFDLDEEDEAEAWLGS